MPGCASANPKTNFWKCYKLSDEDSRVKCGAKSPKTAQRGKRRLPLTQVVIKRELVIVPDLEDQLRTNFVLCLV